MLSLILINIDNLKIYYGRSCIIQILHMNYIRHRVSKANILFEFQQIK